MKTIITLLAHAILSIANVVILITLVDTPYVGLWTVVALASTASYFLIKYGDIFAFADPRVAIGGFALSLTLFTILVLSIGWSGVGTYLLASLLSFVAFAAGVLVAGYIVYKFKRLREKKWENTGFPLDFDDFKEMAEPDGYLEDPACGRRMDGTRVGPTEDNPWPTPEEVYGLRERGL